MLRKGNKGSTRRPNPNGRSAAGARKRQKAQNNDLRIMAPSAYGRSAVTRQPEMKGSSSGSFIVRHREFIGDVVASPIAGLFYSTSYAVNPGQPGTFPWLSSIAQNFESYAFRSLSFDFESAVATTDGGVVLIAADYDVNDVSPGNKQQMMSYHGAVRSNIWSHCSFRSDSSDRNVLSAKRFVRVGSQPVNSDPKTYDVANLFIATQGCTAALSVGELYVTYEIEFWTPQSNGALNFSSASSKIVVGAGITAAKPLGSAQTITGYQNFTVDASGLVITFANAGEYLFECACTGTVFTANPPTLTMGSRGVTSVATTIVAPVANAAATSAVWSFAVQVNSPGDSLTFNSWAAAFCTTLTALTIRVSPYAYSLA